jgi:signal transduction histidine kinase/ActR/RegA family two-component response regulator
VSVPYSREILLELVTLHARVLQRMPVVQLLLIAVLAMTLAGQVSPALFLGWAGLTLTIEIGRAVYATRLLRPEAVFDPSREHRRMVAIALLAGAGDGMSGVLFLPVLSLENQALLGIVLFAIPAAGVAVSMSSRYIAGAFSVSVIAPACVTWGLIHASQLVTAVGSGAIYCSLLIIVAIESERLLLRSVMIRHERDRVVRDLERRNADVREAVERAEQAAHSRTRVLASASHDLRQPLHALSVYSAILAADPSPQTLREVGQNIDQIVRSLGQLLHGLLDLSRLAVSHYVAEREPFPMDQLLADVCAEHASAAQAKGLVLHHALSPLVIRGDAMAVARIARNLIDNAIKYTDEGAVRVELRRDAGEALLSVKDTGRGIPDTDHDRVFEEFYQVGNPSRDRSQGVGLGLAIVKRLTELMDGSVSFTSRLGEGTCFVLRVPGAESPAPESSLAVPAPEPPAETRSLHAHRVFVVDDELDIRDSMTLLLRHWGMEVHTASGIDETETLFERLGKPDLMITDLRLRTEEHGCALADRLQQSHGAFRTMIVTGETSSQALREANASGYPLLQKPVDAHLLHAAVHSALAQTPATG